MSAELISILGVGVALAGLLNSTRGLRSENAQVRGEPAEPPIRVARSVAGSHQRANPGQLLLRHVVVFSLALMAAAHPTEVTAQNVTRCGPSASGHAFRFQEANSDTPKGRWESEIFSIYDILLTYDTEGPDIIYTDVRGTRSARANGGVVFEIPALDPGFRIILVAFPTGGTVEHFLFGLDEDGVGTVITGTIRSPGILVPPKSSLVEATCQSP